MNNVVVTRAKHENGFLEIFINHYLNLGFDFIYIFIENNENYNIINSKVDFITHNYKGNKVIPFIFNNFLEKQQEKKRIDWVLHIDVDEFLFLKYNIKINEYISKFSRKNIGQFIFKWAMIENLRSIDTENDFQNIAAQCELYSNNHYKSMINLEYLKKKNNAHAHVSDCIKDTYLDNIKIKSKLNGICQETNNYTNAILVHYHTRCLENLFVKALVTNLSAKKIEPKILEQKYIANKLKEKMKKLQLPFIHKKNGEILNKKNIMQFKFNTNTKIDNKIIHNMLEEVCKIYNVNYNTVINYIKELELKYSKHFLCE
tara:strand:- start:387 stop:1334 length:948 start_codon:yes stop_codon:yes gene_type:complete